MMHVIRALGCAAIFTLAAAAQPQYDLLIKGGLVVDARNGLSAVRDVGIANHLIAAVAANIDASKALKVIDAKGLYVTPGLVDIHVHVYGGVGEKNSYAGDNSIYPDGLTFRSGVTTTRVLAMLNIVGKGMRGGKFEQDLTDMDAKATAEQGLKYPSLVVGIKTAHYSGPEWTPVERVIEAGTLSILPVMVDFGTFVPQRPYAHVSGCGVHAGRKWQSTILFG